KAGIPNRSSASACGGSFSSAPRRRERKKPDQSSTVARAAAQALQRGDRANDIRAPSTECPAPLSGQEGGCFRANCLRNPDVVASSSQSNRDFYRISPRCSTELIYICCGCCNRMVASPQWSWRSRLVCQPPPVRGA